MDGELSTDIIKATQISLGKYVKRPPLTEKLLTKPPFRFLHDIVTSVLKTTGFFKGVFEEEELISDNVKDRESKILFLNKVISVISLTTGKSLLIKPSKIIAGQEPDRTNELLQYLASALDNNLSSDEAAKSVKESLKLSKSGDKKTQATIKPLKKSIDTKKISAKGSDNSIKSDNATKLRYKDNVVKRESPPKKSLQSSKGVIKKLPVKDKQINKNNNSLTNTSDKNSNIESLENLVNVESVTNYPDLALDNIDIHNHKDLNQEANIDCNSAINNANSKKSSTLEEDYENKTDLNKIEDNIIHDDKIAKNSVMENSKIQHENEYEHKDEITNIKSEHQEPMLVRKTEVENGQRNAEENKHNEHIENTTEIKITDTSIMKRPSSVRPSSSRPGAPRLREKNENIITSVENIVGVKVNIIAENTFHDEEDESSIVIMDNTDTLEKIEEEKQKELQVSEQHGHLVQQILNAQKEFTHNTGKTEIEWQFGAQKARDVVNQEIDLIRFNVQALSRVANPLGKLLDHIQEDVEVMRQELYQWTTVYENASKELLKQNIANEEYLLPLHARIKQLDMDITEKQYKINDLKIVIHKNASRIDKLLTSGIVE